ncbi:TMEM43 family protein [Mesorhizobium sp. KR2-14]|uniref:TMEM43 family protein n=1 Tax=Mesorhizobium sp. KR2-14 TaxID=3156610 RepID=UPI0032B5E98B
MSDSIVKTTSVSWFERIKQSVLGALIGFILVLGAVVLLFWNEGRTVTTARSLAEGASAVVAVPSQEINPANEGRLVHISGTVTTDEILADEEFGIEVEGIRLVRTVEMYQWHESTSEETKKTLGGGEETVTTYSYSKAWSDEPIDSSRFEQPAGHDNPSMELESDVFQVSEARINAFALDDTVLDEIGDGRALKLSSDQQRAIEAAWSGYEKVTFADGAVYLGDNPKKPAVGDYRVRYELVPLGPVSVVGKQTGNSFQAYQTRAGDRLLLVESGSVPADTMFANAASENTLLSWIIRAAGLVVLMIGFAMMMQPLGVIADVIPLLGDVVRLGTGLAAFLFTIIVGTATIAIAWFYYRPLLALGVLVVGGAITVALVRFFKARKKPAAASVVA